MSEISRRGFLKGAQAGLVAAGIVAVAPVTLSAAASAATSKKLEARNALHRHDGERRRSYSQPSIRRDSDHGW
jgi:anaerobic selenocysteine-containing dehydrogenase